MNKPIRKRSGSIPRTWSKDSEQPSVKSSEVYKKKREAFDHKRLSTVRYWVFILVGINIFFQTALSLNFEAGLRAHLVNGFYWTLTVAVIILLVRSYKKEIVHVYYALVIVSLRNILPLHDLDGVDGFTTLGNSIYLVIFQVLGAVFSTFYVSLSFRQSSYPVAMLFLILYLSGVIRTLYSWDEIQAPENLVFIILTTVAQLAFQSFFFNSQIQVYSEFFSEIVHSSELNRQLETILNNLEEAIVIFSHDDGLSVEFVNRQCHFLLPESLLVKSTADLTEIVINNINTKIFREYKSQEEDEAVPSPAPLPETEATGAGSTYELSLADILCEEPSELAKKVFRIKYNSRGQPSKLRQYVQIKAKKFQVESEDKTAVQIIDISKSILYDQVKAKTEFHSLMNATVSHEMRNPLNSIINQNFHLGQVLQKFNQALRNLDQFTAPATCGEQLLPEDIQQRGILRDLKEIEREFQTVARIHSSSSKSLKFLVNDILDFARIRQDKFTKDEKPFNVIDAINEIVEIQQYQADTLGIQLETKLEAFASNPLMTTDPLRLQQVLQNLMANAMKFTPRGKITIAAMPVQRRGTWYVKIQVRDTGCGIKEEDSSKLFNLFGTLDRTSQQNTQGIGLGLVICQKIVHEFCGDIYFKSRFGRGTIFTFEFRLSQYDGPGEVSSRRRRTSSELSFSPSEAPFGLLTEEVKEEEKEPEPAKFSNEMTSAFPRVLVVDDQVFNVDAMEVLLKACRVPADTQLHKVYGGQEALDHVRCQASDLFYHLILIDCNMPFMDGYETTIKIRRHCTEAGLPQPVIYAVTGHLEEQYQIKAELSGMTGVIGKPASMQQVNLAIAHARQVFSNDEAPDRSRAQSLALLSSPSRLAESLNMSVSIPVLMPPQQRRRLLDSELLNEGFEKGLRSGFLSRAPSFLKECSSPSQVSLSNLEIEADENTMPQALGAICSVNAIAAPQTFFSSNCFQLQPNLQLVQENAAQ